MNGQKVQNQSSCCDLCNEMPECGAWIYGYADLNPKLNGQNCWLMRAHTMNGTRTHVGRIVGTKLAPPAPPSPAPSPCDGLPEDTCTDPHKFPRVPSGWCCIWEDGKCQKVNQHLKPNLLHWPSPLQKKAYALTDSPRFFVPDWDLTPAAQVAPELKPTNGYDFRNHVDGDTFIFLLGDDLESWHHSRAEFVALAGSTPLLPDYAFGVWFTWWHQFTQAEAKSNVSRWATDNLPIDIWALE